MKILDLNIKEKTIQDYDKDLLSFKEEIDLEAAIAALPELLEVYHAAVALMDNSPYTSDDYDIDDLQFILVQAIQNLKERHCEKR